VEFKNPNVRPDPNILDNLFHCYRLFKFHLLVGIKARRSVWTFSYKFYSFRVDISLARAEFLPDAGTLKCGWSL
jgi:hypothetical protein